MPGDVADETVLLVLKARDDASKIVEDNQHVLDDYKRHVQDTAKSVRDSSDEMNKAMADMGNVKGGDVHGLVTGLQDAKASINDVSQASDRAKLSLGSFGSGGTNNVNQLNAAANNAAGPGGGMGKLKIVAAALPAVIGPLGSVVTALGVGLAGAGAAGLAGMMALKVGIGATLSNVNAAATAQQNYNIAVQQFGAHSTQAKSAMQQLKMAEAQLSPTEKLMATEMGNFKNALQNWQQAFDPYLLPAFNQGLSTIRTGLSALTPIVRGALGGLTSSFAVLQRDLQGLLKAGDFTTFGNIVKQVFSAIGPIIGNLVQMLVHFVDAARPLITVVLGLLERFTAYLAHVDFSKFIGPLVTDLVRLGPIVGRFIMSILQLAQTIIKAMSPLGTAVFKVLSTAIASVIPTLKQLGSLIATIAPVVGMAANVLASSLGTALQALAPLISSLIPVIHLLVTGFAAGFVLILKIATPALTAILGVIETVFKSIVSAFGSLTPAIKTLMDDMSRFTFVFPAVGNVIKSMAPMLTDLMKAIASLAPAFAVFFGTLAAVSGTIREDIVPAMAKLAIAVGTALASALRAVAPILPVVANAIASFTGLAAQGLGSLIQAITPIVPLIGTALTDALRIVTPLLKAIPAPVLGAALVFLKFRGPIMNVVDALSRFGPFIQRAIGGIASLIARVVSGEAEQTAAMEAGVAEREAINAAGNDAMIASDEAVGVAADAVMGPAGLIIMGLSIIVPLIISHWRTIEKWGVDAWHGIEDAWKVVSGAIMTGVHAVAGFFERNWRTIVTVVAGLLMGPMGAAIAYIATHWSQMGNIARDVWRMIRDIFDVVMDHIRSIFTSYISALEAIWRAFQTIATNVWDAIKTIFNEVWNFLFNTIKTDISLWEGWWRTFQTITSAVWNAIKSAINTVLNGIQTIFSGAVQFFENQWHNLQNVTVTIFNDIKNAIGSVFTHIKNFVSTAITDIVNFFKHLPGEIMNALSGLPGTFMKFAKNLVSSFLDPFKNFGGGIVHGLWKGISRFGGKALHAVGLATGGIVTQATHAIVGEAGPEAVIPLTGHVAGNVKTWLLEALQIDKAPLNWLPALEIIVQGESSGNPYAINRTDINAQEGHPSEGLMQTIMSTFMGYVPPQLAKLGIFNPVANAAAAIRYIEARYGTPYNTPGVRSEAHGGPYIGYDAGGLLPPGLHRVANLTGQPEIILPPGAGQVGPGGNTTVIDLRGAQVMSDRDIDLLTQRIGYALGTRVLPGAGVQVRRR